MSLGRRRSNFTGFTQLFRLGQSFAPKREPLKGRCRLRMGSPRESAFGVRSRSVPAVSPKPSGTLNAARPNP